MQTGRPSGAKSSVNDEFFKQVVPDWTLKNKTP